MTRKTDYLFLRDGSRNWQIKLQYPDGERLEMSLGTPDRAQAEILALPYIQEHKVRLFARRDLLERSVSLLVALPRDRFNAELRHRLPFHLQIRPAIIPLRGGPSAQASGFPVDKLMLGGIGRKRQHAR